MARSTQKKKYIKHLKVPLDVLWDGNIPLTIRVYMMINDAYPKEISTSTLTNVLGDRSADDKGRKAVKGALKALASRGQIVRREGENRLVAEGLPEASPEGLRCIQGWFGGKRLKRQGIPTPLRRALLGQQSANLAAIPYRFTEAEMSWLISRDAFADPAFWARQLGQRIVGSKELFSFAGQVMNALQEHVDGPHIDGLTNPSDALVPSTLSRIDPPLLVKTGPPPTRLA